MGTPTYIAPEQVRGQIADARTDIYSLGIIMYEIFTGVPPYLGQDAMAILFQHIEGKATPPRQKNQDISASLEGVILKAIAVDPDGRFQSMSELEQSLAALATQEI